MRHGRLQARGVSHRFARATVLDDATLTVDAGEVVLLSGVNGAGKTTLIRILAGVLRPDAGTCERVGRMGYLPQRGDEPPPRISVGEWLSAVRGMRRGNPAGDAPELLAALGVRSTAQRLDRASRGTVAKVMLVAALVDRPDLVLLDEPFASLDTAGRVAAAELLQRAADDGAAVLVSEHGDRSVLAANRGVHLLDGRLQQTATAASQAGWRIVLSGDDGSRQLLVTAGERDRVLYDALRRGERVLLVEPV